MRDEYDFSKARCAIHVAGPVIHSRDGALQLCKRCNRVLIDDRVMLYPERPEWFDTDAMVPDAMTEPR
jgi:hypothetical protein